MKPYIHIYNLGCIPSPPYQMASNRQDPLTQKQRRMSVNKSHMHVVDLPSDRRTSWRAVLTAAPSAMSRYLALHSTQLHNPTMCCGQCPTNAAMYQVSDPTGFRGLQ